MTERMASGWMTVRGWIQELCDSERRSQDGSNGNWGDITEEMQIEALKEAYEELKGNGRRREYHFRSDPRRYPQRPPL